MPADLGAMLGATLPPGSAAAEEVAQKLDRRRLESQLLRAHAAGTAWQLDSAALYGLLDWSTQLICQQGAFMLHLNSVCILFFESISYPI